jgi:hypothetical protein
VRTPSILAVILFAACATGDVAAPCPAAAGDLVITEIFADHAGVAGASGADRGHEWIEIYDASARAIDLDGVAITRSRADGAGARTHRMQPVTIAPGAYLVLGDVDPAARPAWIGYGYGTDLGALGNGGGGRLAIACGDVEVDAVTYAGAVAGRSLELDGRAPPDATGNDDPARWCAADPPTSTEFEPANFGTPGFANAPCVAPPAPGMCVDDDTGAARPIVAPGPGMLRISEVMADPTAVADRAGEWIEVEAAADVDLIGVQLGGATLDATPVVVGPGCARLAAGGLALFARSADASANGGLPAVDGTFHASLANSHGAAQLGVGGAVIDRVTWDAARPGVSLQRDGDRSCDAPAGTPTYDGADVGTPKRPASVPCP